MTLSGLTLGLALLASSAASADDAPGFERWQASRAHPLLLLAPSRASEVVLRVAFDVGSTDDGRQPGLTRLAQHAVLFASRQTSAAVLHDLLYGASAELAIETDMRSCAFVLRAPASEFAAIARVLLPMLLQPAVDARAFERARTRMLQEQLNPAESTLVPLFAELVVQDPAFSNRPSGDPDSVRSIALRTVQAHVARHLLPARAVLSAAGGFKPAALKTLVKRYRGGQARARRAAPRVEPGVFYMETPFEIHVMAFPVQLHSARDVAAAMIAAAMLEETLLRQLREGGLAYAVSVQPLHRDWLDFLLVVVPVNSRAQVPIEQHLRAAIEAHLAGPDRAAAFERNRSTVWRRLQGTAEQPAAAVELLAASSPAAPWYGAALGTELRAIDERSLVDTSRPWLDLSKSIYIRFSPRPPSTAGGAR